MFTAVSVPEEVKYILYQSYLCLLIVGVGLNYAVVPSEGREVITLWGFAICHLTVLVSLLKRCGQRYRIIYDMAQNNGRFTVCSCLNELYTMIRTQQQKPHCPPLRSISAILTALLTEVYMYSGIISSVESEQLCHSGWKGLERYKEF